MRHCYRQKLSYEILKGHPHMQLKERVQKGPAGDPFVAKARIYMALVDNPGTLPDPTPDAPDPDDFNNPTNRPGR